VGARGLLQFVPKGRLHSVFRLAQTKPEI